MMLRVDAEHWYETRTLEHGVTYIGEPHIREFYRCNIWHVVGRDRNMLFDSGMGVVSLRKYVAAEADLLAKPTRRNTLAEDYVTDDIFTALPPEPYLSVEYAVKAAPASRVVTDGDVIDLGDRHFEVIHTPGHSPGGIALWEKATKILFSGDVVYDGPLIEDVYHSDADDYFESMKRLYDMPVQTVHGGHFGSYDRTRHREIISAWLSKRDPS